jgi:hypothetical protein
MAGYSGTPLVKKLGFKPGMRVAFRGAPANYRKLLGPLPDDITIATRLNGEFALIHSFVTTRAALVKEVVAALKVLAKDGALWVSWPKKASGVATDVTEDVIRAVALPTGLVDVKVCAVDETWSGLKLTLRLKNR